jgi:argininosuccinate synthase
MSQWLVAHNFPYRDSVEKAYSTDANILGATHEAKDLENLDASIEIVNPIMGVEFWDSSISIACKDPICTGAPSCN